MRSRMTLCSTPIFPDVLRALGADSGPYLSKASTEQIAEALVEEYVHLSSGETDGSISFEKALVKSIVRLIYPRRVTIESL